jgi:hypothetical protein
MCRGLRVEGCRDLRAEGCRDFRVLGHRFRGEGISEQE